MLRPKPRRPSTNLLDLLDDDLRTLVAGALHRLRRQPVAVRFTGVALPGRAERSLLVAEPVPHADGALTHILLLVRAGPRLRGARRRGGRGCSRAAAPAAPMPVAGRVEVHELSHEQALALQDELAYTKENLQATIEELETSNEELQATNEELVASNEELQSTNEELHSVNEELYTVNAEYQKKIAELQELNDDIEHLLDAPTSARCSSTANCASGSSRRASPTSSTSLPRMSGGRSRASPTGCSGRT